MQMNENLFYGTIIGRTEMSVAPLQSIIKGAVHLIYEPVIIYSFSLLDYPNKFPFSSMARALVSAIAEELGSIISSEFRLTISVEEEVQKLESIFRTIQVVLNDAEKRQLKDDAVKLWLDKLKDVSHLNPNGHKCLRL